ncbi:MAG: histidine phosphatase family protein [Myxococcota bacterium]
MPADQATILTIVRHGQTAANIEGVWHGSTNTPLTEHGRRQAEATAAWLAEHRKDVTRVYASPLDRAHHTARPIAERYGARLVLEPGLVEFDLGRWEGTSFHVLFEERRLFHHMKQDPHFAPHGGESPMQVGHRLSGTLRRLASDHPGERIVVVTHGGALSIALGLLLDDDYSSWNRMVRNCAVSELVLEPRPELLSFNLIDHLPADPDVPAGH